MTDPTIEAIDNTLTDYDISRDAMRWTPDLPPSRRHPRIVVIADSHQHAVDFAYGRSLHRPTIVIPGRTHRLRGLIPDIVYDLRTGWRWRIIDSQEVEHALTIWSTCNPQPEYRIA